MREFAEKDEDLMRVLVLARSIAGKLRKNTKVRHSIGKLISYSPTRFDSMLACLQCVIKNLPELKNSSS